MPCSGPLELKKLKKLKRMAVLPSSRSKKPRSSRVRKGGDPPRMVPEKLKKLKKLKRMPFSGPLEVKELKTSKRLAFLPLREQEKGDGGIGVGGNRSRGISECTLECYTKRHRVRVSCNRNQHRQNPQNGFSPSAPLKCHLESGAPLTPMYIMYSSGLLTAERLYD